MSNLDPAAIEARYRAKLRARAEGTTKVTVHPATPVGAAGAPLDPVEARYREKLERHALAKPGQQQQPERAQEPEAAAKPIKAEKPKGDHR